MPAKRRFAIQTLIVTVVLNAVLLAAVYVLLGDALQASGQTVLLFVIGAAVTLVLWLLNYYVGSRLFDAEAAAVPVSTAPQPAAPAATVSPTAPAPVVRQQPQENRVAAEQGAVQLLALLQREGRLVDFLREDLRAYDDAQIGAAVRSIHEGSRQALDEHVKLEPIFGEAEGSTVTVEPGFDPRAVRLTGDVAGEPPFRGELRHRGWRVVSVELPKATAPDREQIVAAAEVELRG